MKAKIKKFFGKANRKIIIIAAIIVIAFAAIAACVLAVKWKVGGINSSNYANAENYKRAAIYSKHIVSLGDDQFILPEDAAKSGEIAIVVSDLDNARNAVSQVALKNSGSIYSTLISYASGNIKNGAIVVQIPTENFDAAFSDLKKIGSQLIQESTKQIPIRNVMPMMQPLPASQESSDETISSESTTAEIDNVSSEPLIAPIYYPQTLQDKGYIKIIFADYSANKTSAINERNFSNASSLIGAGYFGQNMRSNFWLVLAIKSILLVILITILVIVGRKIYQALQKSKNRKAPIVKQAVKAGMKTVKIKKK
jgi:hypothetical protein